MENMYFNSSPEEERNDSKFFWNLVSAILFLLLSLFLLPSHIKAGNTDVTFAKPTFEQEAYQNVSIEQRD